MQHQKKKTEKQARRGLTVVELLVLVAAVLLLVGGFRVLQSRSEKDRRDLARLAIIRQAQGALSSLYLARGSYRSAAAGCGSAGDLLSQCRLTGTGVDAMELRDPGKFALTIETVPNDETYAVAFTLERSHGTLRAGRHTLTPAGIQ